MKVVCIKDKDFDFGSNYGGMTFRVKYGETYDCIKGNFGHHNIQDKNNKNLYYPIMIGFDDYFVDLSNYRNKKLENLGI
jgi:hypothetical protein